MFVCKKRKKTGKNITPLLQKKNKKTEKQYIIQKLTVSLLEHKKQPKKSHRKKLKLA